MQLCARWESVEAVLIAVIVVPLQCEAAMALRQAGQPRAAWAQAERADHERGSPHMLKAAALVGTLDALTVGRCIRTSRLGVWRCRGP